MNIEKFEELQERSETSLMEKFKTLKERAEFIVGQELQQMKQEEKVIELTDDEQRMLNSYRQFKKRSKPLKVFSWRTPDDKKLVLPEDVQLIRDPSDVSVG